MISPKEALTGMKPYATKQYTMHFGEYVEVHNETVINSLSVEAERSHSALALYLSGAVDGSWHFFDILEGTRITRRNWINKVNEYEPHCITDEELADEPEDNGIGQASEDATQSARIEPTRYRLRDANYDYQYVIIPSGTSSSIKEYILSLDTDERTVHNNAEVSIPLNTVTYLNAMSPAINVYDMILRKTVIDFNTEDQDVVQVEREAVIVPYPSPSESEKNSNRKLEDKSTTQKRRRSKRIALQRREKSETMRQAIHVRRKIREA